MEGIKHYNTYSKLIYEKSSTHKPLDENGNPIKEI